MRVSLNTLAAHYIPIDAPPPPAEVMASTLQTAAELGLQGVDLEDRLFAATDAGRDEYGRVLARNAQFGVTHVVFAPQNSAASSRANATDTWGWEECLWMTLGERVRRAAWDPRVDAAPQLPAAVFEAPRVDFTHLSRYLRAWGR